MSAVKWSDIVAQCGNYKDGFVAVFRQYEGQPTDEIVRGKVVTVTIKSFAEHNGIPVESFRRWVKTSGHTSAVRPPRSKGDLTRDVIRAARHEPDAVVEGIMQAPERTQDRIFDEIKLRRAGINTTPSHRKATQAQVHQATAPIRRAVAGIGLALVVPTLEQAREELEQAISEGALTDEALEQISEAFDAFALTLAEARLSVS